jgi:hypothetical protein
VLLGSFFSVYNSLDVAQIGSHFWRYLAASGSRAMAVPDPSL